MNHSSLSCTLSTYISILILSGTAISLPRIPRDIPNPFEVNCTPQNCQCGFTQRSSPERDRINPSLNDSYPSNIPLTKRIITPANQHLTTNQFMTKYATLKPPPGPPVINNFVVSGYGWQSAYASFKNNKQQFGIALSDLIGCTAVTVISSTAVWMGHLWEGVADETEVFYREFMSSKKETTFESGMPDPEFTDQQLQTTRKYMQDFLEAPKPSYQVDLWSKRSDFDKPSGRVYIMTPMQPFTNLKREFLLKYQQQIETLQEVIEEATGISKLHTTVVGYDVWEMLTQQDQNTARGRVLYLFDPDVPKKQSLWLEGVEMKGLPKPL